jgi:osmotically-inducible protein OsmY
MRQMMNVFQAGLVSAGLMLGGQALATDHKNVAKAEKKSSGSIKAAKETLNEAMLNSKVRVKLLKTLAGADPLRVEVDVTGTSVRLSGEVEDRASEKIAVEAAKSVDGVTNVRSTIRHNPKAPHQENFEAMLKDSTLTSEVRLNLLQEIGTQAMGIHITSTDGVVSLRGELPNASTRTRALDQVKDMPSVKRVEDLMSVTP